VYLSEKDENVQTAAAAATATTAILMPTATAVPMPETQNHINERSSGNDTTDDDESVR
jgi:hypothetical protein